MKIDFVKRCPFCDKNHMVKVNDSDLVKYKFGNVLIQEAFPYLTADEREIIKTGICPTCWKDMFPPEEEEGAKNEV